MLIGTSQYSHLDALPAVANNLGALAQALSGPLGWGLNRDSCIVVSEPTNATQVLDAVQVAADEATDTLLVYYAGHGLLGYGGGGELYLAATGSVLQREDTGLRYAQLRDMVLHGRAERHVVVLDCCFSGKALGAMSGPSDLMDHAEIEGSYVIASAPRDKVALAPPGEPFTAFTGELIEVLRCGIPGGPALLDLDDVFTHIRKRLKAKGRPAPQKRDRNTAGWLALGRNPAYRQPPLAHESRQESGVAVRSWPDPNGIRTAQGFILSLRRVREVSGMRNLDISRYSGGKISKGTVSSLQSRESMPKLWRTVEAYLSACGVPENEVTHWKKTWKRLRDEEDRAVVTKDKSVTEVPGEAEKSRSAAWKQFFRRGVRTKGG
ncbi:caspase, EACC1-associated type [Streptomyces albireticuli]|uniref:caspase, EACC1-associated type n=1 Tax=Streptomyces albireticuli TaxID=1940 RepID=UPI001F1BCB90|nr:caspase family protein [Streptomyces albireticuli]